MGDGIVKEDKMDETELNAAMEDISEGLFPGSKGSDEDNLDLKSPQSEDDGKTGEDAEKLPPKKDDKDQKADEDATKKDEKAELDKKTEDKGDEDKSAKPEDETAKSPVAPPKTWRPDAIKEWDKIPPTAQAEILKREEDMFKGIESYKGDATIGKALKGIVEPHAEFIRKEGIEPLYLINNLLQAHTILSQKADSEQKRHIFKQLAESYGVVLDGQAQTEFDDPEIVSLRKELAELKSTVNTTQTEAMRKAQESLQQEIAAFASDPEHPHFDTVSTEIASLIRSGAAKDLKTAYEQAIWLNPTTRALETERIAAEKVEEAKKAAKEAADKAEKATAANLKTTAPKVGSSTAPLGSMDDTLKETFEAIQARR